MFNRGNKKARRYFYADQKNYRHRTRWVILGILVFFLFYVSFTSLIFSVRVLENNTMAPNLHAGDRIIFSSFTIYSLFSGGEPRAFDAAPSRTSASNSGLKLERSYPPFRRGNVVLVDMFRGGEPGLFRRFLDGTVRFFTAQRVSLAEQQEYLYVKRVIGLPGDEITMTNYVVRVKVRGSSYSLTEFEVTEQDYTPDIPQMPALWDSSLPFSGNMDTITLGENECFVLSDDRSNTNDSRTWGPVPINSIIGKALFRYWPLTRFGRP